MQKRNHPAKAEEENRKEDEEDEVSEHDGPEFIVPDDRKGLYACLHCGLIKTKSQWASGEYCENCGALMRLQSSQKATKFTGIIALINPANSFIRKKASIHLRPGRGLKGAAYGI